MLEDAVLLTALGASHYAELFQDDHGGYVVAGDVFGMVVPFHEVRQFGLTSWLSRLAFFIFRARLTTRAIQLANVVEAFCFGNYSSGVAGGLWDDWEGEGLPKP